MKKALCFLMGAAVILCLFAGCGKTKTPVPAPEVSQVSSQGSPEVSRAPKPSEKPAPVSTKAPAGEKKEEHAAGELLQELTVNGERMVTDGDYLYCWNWPDAPDALCRIDREAGECVILDEMFRMTDDPHLCLADGYLYYYNSRRRMVCRIGTDGSGAEREFFDPDYDVYSMQIENGWLYLNVNREVWRLSLSESAPKAEKFDVGAVVEGFAVVGDTLFYAADEEETGQRSLYRRKLTEGKKGPGEQVDTELWELPHALGDSVYYVTASEKADPPFRLKRCGTEGKPQDPVAAGMYIDQLTPGRETLFYTKEVDLSAEEYNAILKEMGLPGSRSGNVHGILVYRYDPQTGKERLLFPEAVDLDAYELHGAAGDVLWMTAGNDGYYGQLLSVFGSAGETWLRLDPGSGFVVSRGKYAPTPTPLPTPTPESTPEPEPSEPPEDQEDGEQYGPGTSELELSADKDRAACFRLVRMDGTTQFMEFLNPGEDRTVSFPSGRYILKIAEGTKWISDQEAFGSSGRYSSTDVFTFEEGYSYYISAGTRGDFYSDSAGGFLD